MRFTPEHHEELNLLLLYKLTTTQEGIKVHKNADAETIAAAKRLHEKGLTTQEDGGYLTALGHEAAEQAHLLAGLLSKS
jgi:uncharacterized protein (TIGR02647 family)